LGKEEELTDGGLCVTLNSRGERMKFVRRAEARSNNYPIAAAAAAAAAA